MPYIVCSIIETCCDTSGVGGECCNRCEECIGNTCLPTLDGSACPGSPGLSCCNLGGGAHECVDLDSSNDNCGSCGITCDVEAGNGCCSGTCVDPATDINNCGTCGNVCDVPGMCCYLGVCSFVGC